MYTYIHTHTTEYYSPPKKSEKMSFAASWMDLEMVILSAVNQTEKDKYHMISLTHGIKKNDTGTYLQNRNRLTDIENKFLVTKGEEGGGGIDEVYEINKHIQPHIRQINNKVLLYSTEKYIQYLLITYSGKESEKEYIYIYTFHCKRVFFSLHPL